MTATTTRTTNPIALVTGANRGIGREIARQLLARRAVVVVTAREAAEAVQAAAELVSEAGGTAWGLGLDVRDAASAAAAAGEVEARHGRLDVLVNNAGIMIDAGTSLLDTPEALIRETLETNTLGVLRVTRALWPLLTPGGRVINLGSGGGQLSEPAGFAPAYCLSKTGISAVTVQLAHAGKPDGVAVNVVCPGWVRTDMGGPDATRSVAEGADTPVWLALEAPPELTGRFLRDRAEIPW